jgi:hypothetical protein
MIRISGLLSVSYLPEIAVTHFMDSVCPLCLSQGAYEAPASGKLSPDGSMRYVPTNSEVCT